MCSSTAAKSLLISWPRDNTGIQRPSTASGTALSWNGVFCSLWQLNTHKWDQTSSWNTSRISQGSTWIKSPSGKEALTEGRAVKNCRVSWEPESWGCAAPAPLKTEHAGRNLPCKCREADPKPSLNNLDRKVNFQSANSQSKCPDPVDSNWSSMPEFARAGMKTQLHGEGQEGGKGSRNGWTDKLNSLKWPGRMREGKFCDADERLSLGKRPGTSRILHSCQDILTKYSGSNPQAV